MLHLSECSRELEDQEIESAEGANNFANVPDIADALVWVLEEVRNSSTGTLE